MRREIIGRGGSSKVFRVSPLDEQGNPVLGIQYALKRVVTTNRQQFELFKNEIDLLNRLKGKPNIIQIVDSEVPEYGHGHGENKSIFSSLNNPPKQKERSQQLKVVMEFGDLDLNKFLQQQ